MKTTVVLLAAAVASVAVPGVAGNAVRFVSCFEESTYEGEEDLTANTFAECVEHCVLLGKELVGFSKNSMSCRCEDKIPEKGEVDQTLCNITCQDNNNLTCGGVRYISLYDVISEVASDSTDEVTLLVSTTSGLILFNSTDDTKTTLMVGNSNFNDYNLRKNLAFSLMSNMSLYKTSLKTKGNSNSSFIGKVNACWYYTAFAVDWERDRIYWADCIGSVNTIKTMDLEGRHNYSLGVTSPKKIFWMVIDPYDRLLFWANSIQIETCGLQGENYHVLLSSLNAYPEALTLDIPSHKLFYVQRTFSRLSLYSVDYDGRNTRLHFTDDLLTKVYGLGVSRDYVYWVHYATRDFIFKAAIRPNGTQNVGRIKSFTEHVYHMTVVDPDNQKEPAGRTPQLPPSTRPTTPSSTTAARTAESLSPTTNPGTTSATPNLTVGSCLEVVALISLLLCSVLLSGILAYWWRRRRTLSSLPITFTRRTESAVGSSSDLVHII